MHVGEREEETRNIVKKIYGCILMVKFVFGLYVLLFVTQGHPTWGSIIDTVKPIQGTKITS